MIEAKVTLTLPEANGRQFVGRTGRGHHFLIDDKDGGSAPTPVEYVASAIAGCTAFDVITILRKKRQRVTAYEVFVEADQAPTPPTVFTKVRIRHVITGHDVDADAVKDAIHLSETKYCSVGAMIGKSAAIETTYEIVPAHAEQTVSV